MSGSQTKVTITHDIYDVYGDLQSKMITAKMSKEARALALAHFIESIQGGVRNASIAVTIDDGVAAKATGTIAFSGVGAANDTVLINGVTFTAVASGSTGNQWNVGASATLSAANLAAAIAASASALVSQHVTAAALTGTVTISALAVGAQGNAVTIAKGVDAGTVMTVSGARLTLGTNSGNASSYTDSFGV